MSTAEPGGARPARGFAEASERFAALAALDGPDIAATGRSRFYAHGERTGLAVVLLHGFTNAPQQWAQFAERLHARGHTVVVPRLPGHGHADRASEAIARVPAAAYLATANAAFDIACGCGERVTVAGISLGGTLSVRLAQARSEPARVVAVAPLFGLPKLGIPLNSVLARALGFFPNAFVPWDPADPRSTPPHAYPRFPTRGLAVVLRLGLEAYASAALRVPAGRTTMVLNAHDPAVSNSLSAALAARFAAARQGAADVVELEGLPKNHDIVDPTNPEERVADVYPRLQELVES